MNLSSEAILEFVALYERYFGEKLSFEEAKVEAEIFLKYFDLISTV